MSFGSLSSFDEWYWNLERPESHKLIIEKYIFGNKLQNKAEVIQQTNFKNKSFLNNQFFFFVIIFTETVRWKTS